jgi:ATP citrate (pro-S)-lyase
LVAKPDQLIKRRGKLGLVKIKLDLPAAKAWIAETMDSEITVS